MKTMSSVHSTNKTKTSPVLCTYAAQVNRQTIHECFSIWTFMYTRESIRLLFVSIPVPSRLFIKVSRKPQKCFGPAKHLLKCKEAIWRWWTKEYLWGLCERHHAQQGAGGDMPAVGDVVIIKTEDKNWGKWLLGIIENLIVGSDRVVRILHVVLVFSFPFAASVGALNVQLSSGAVKHNIYIQCGATWNKLVAEQAVQ